MTSHILFSITKQKISPTAMYYYMYVDICPREKLYVSYIEHEEKLLPVHVYDSGQSGESASIHQRHSRHCTVNIPPCSMNAEQILNLCSTLLIMVTFL